MNRYLIYCRKSTEEEDRQVLSIESQIQEVKRYAEREGLHVLELIQEARSAKSPGRPVFNELLKRIQRGDADGILAWHPDRLARNALDGGQILHLLDTGKLLTLRFPTYTFENTPQGKFMLTIMFGQSKYYVDSLSENVRRGNRTKREKGWLPSNAPTGYVNAIADSGEKIIAIDAERFTLLRRMWELFLSGAYSVPEVLRIATYELGFRTRKRRRVGGAPLTASGLYRIFANPFYAGYIVYADQWYRGRHEPMITLEQFEQAQQLLGRPHRARPRLHRFAYTGLIRCGTCGCAVTAEAKINRYGTHYVYYHCGHKSQRVVCKERSVEQEELERQILRFLESVYLEDAVVKEVLAILEGESQKDAATGGVVRDSLEKALAANRAELDNLTRMRRRELIPDEEFLRQRAEVLRERERLQERLEAVCGQKWVEPSRKLILFAHRAKFWLTHGDCTEKRLILSTIGSNLLLTQKILHIDAKKPFRILDKRANHTDLWATVNDVRTFFEENPDFSVPLLPEPAFAEVAA